MKTKEDYLKFHRECCEKMIKITAAKNHDYAGFTENPFANFKVVEDCDIASVEQGFLTRIMDKISRVNSFVKQGVCNVEEEKIEDTLLDAANYMILMAGYIKSKKDKIDKLFKESKIYNNDDIIVDGPEPIEEYKPICVRQELTK